MLRNAPSSFVPERSQGNLSVYRSHQSLDGMKMLIHIVKMFVHIRTPIPL